MDKTQKVRQALLGMQRHSWEQGVTMQALLERGEGEAVIPMAFDAVCRQDADGRAAIVGRDGGVTDPCCAGEPLLWAARQTGEAALAQGAERLLRWAMTGASRAGDGTVYHLLEGRQIWVDSLYMLPPFLAAAGEGREAWRQTDGMYRRLRDPKDGLMHSRWDEDRQAYAAPEYWGVGNGWALAGMTRTAALLPEDMAGERDELRRRVKDLLNALRPLTRPDGRFHNVVDDPSTFPETNLGQMAAYTVYRGCREGWLEGSLLPWADDMRRAAEGMVDPWGLVRGVCGAPRFDEPGIAPEGQAFFLLMEREYDLLNGVKA